MDTAPDVFDRAAQRAEQGGGMGTDRKPVKKQADWSPVLDKSTYPSVDEQVQNAADRATGTNKTFWQKLTGK